MTFHIVPPRPASIVSPEMHSGNNFLASPTGLQRVADALNYITCRQKKLIIARFSTCLGPPVPSGAGTIHIYPAYFRTGENTTALDIYVGMTQALFASSNPSTLKCLVKTTGGSTVNAAGEGEVTYDGGNAGSTVAPSEISHKKLRVTGLSPDTEYRLENEITEGTSVIYLIAMEAPVRHADDSVAGVCSPAKYVAQGPIYDEHLDDLKDANNRIWKHCGSHLLSYTCDYEASPSGTGIVSISGSTVYVDIMSAREHYLAALYHNTRRRTTVPLKMAVLADRTAGTGTLDLRLTDGTNNIDVTAIGDGGSTAWVTATGSMPPTLDGWKFQAKQSNGTTTHLLYGVSLFEYEA